MVRLAAKPTGSCYVLAFLVTWTATGSLLAAASSAVEPGIPAGTWVGERHGRAVTWRLETSGRLRVDGCPADYSIACDTLMVRFDPTGAESGAGETAVYRFWASLPPSGPARLYVYGFDLGSLGQWLEREVPVESPLPEDAAPPAPAVVTPPPRNAAHGSRPATSTESPRAASTPATNGARHPRR